MPASPPNLSCAVAAPVATTASRVTRTLTVRRSRMSTTPCENRTLIDPSYGWISRGHRICDGRLWICDEMRFAGGESCDEMQRLSGTFYLLRSSRVELLSKTHRRLANERPPTPRLRRGLAAALRAKADASEPTRAEWGSWGPSSERVRESEG